jgi:hypothetical protein
MARKKLDKRRKRRSRELQNFRKGKLAVSLLELRFGVVFESCPQKR